MPQFKSNNDTKAKEVTGKTGRQQSNKFILSQVMSPYQTNNRAKQ